MKALIASLDEDAYRKAMNAPAPVAGDKEPATQPRSVKIGLLEDDKRAAFRDLETTGGLDVLSRPSIQLFDNQDSTFPSRPRNYHHHRLPPRSPNRPVDSRQTHSAAWSIKLGITPHLTPAKDPAANPDVRLITLDVDCSNTELLRLEESPAPNTPADLKLVIQKTILDTHSPKTARWHCQW